jgi:hypothetical protein
MHACTHQGLVNKQKCSMSILCVQAPCLFGCWARTSRRGPPHLPSSSSICCTLLAFFLPWAKCYEHLAPGSLSLMSNTIASLSDLSPQCVGRLHLNKVLILCFTTKRTSTKNCNHHNHHHHHHPHDLALEISQLRGVVHEWTTWRYCPQSGQKHISVTTFNLLHL